MTETNFPERTALYRLYDADGRLLYVGITNNPQRRWTQHALDKRDTWWSQVDRTTIDWFDSREQADAAETAAVREEKPLRNRSKTPAGQLLEFHEPKLPIPESIMDMHKPRFLRVAEALRRELEDTQGGAVPSGRMIVERFGISHVTANKVLRHLADAGVIRREGRRYLRVSHEQRNGRGL